MSSVPFSGIRPFSISFWNCMYAMKPQALIVQKSTIGTPSSFAALTVNDMFPSETTQLTGGTWTELLLLSLESRFRNGSKQFFLVDSQRDGMSCVASAFWSGSLGGRPSGIDSKRKSGKPSREFGPRDLSRRLRLYSVWTKVMWKPLWWRSLANFSIGFMWPCAGHGIHTAWGLFGVCGVNSILGRSLQ